MLIYFQGMNTSRVPSLVFCFNFCCFSAQKNEDMSIFGKRQKIGKSL